MFQLTYNYDIIIAIFDSHLAEMKQRIKTYLQSYMGVGHFAPYHYFKINCSTLQ